MLKVAVVDLDGEGQVANNDARAAKAKEVARTAPQRKYWDTFYAMMFQPDLVRLDQLNPGADQAILELLAGWMIIYLTSRPEYMRAETERWLRGYRLLNEPIDTWLREEHDGLSQVVMKDYGTDVDPRDRYVKTREWKAKKVKEIWTRLNPEAMLFIDDTEENREAIADLENPRIMVKYSLQDALETDQFLHPQHSRNASELLMCVESIVNAACVRERFEHDEKFMLRVEHKSPGDDPAWKTMPLVIRTYNKGGQHFVSVTELLPLKGGREIEALTITMEALEGKALDVVLGDFVGGETPIVEATEEELKDEGVVYSHPFQIGDPEEEKRLTEGFATWKAKNLREFLYVEAARYQREVRLWEMRASMEYAGAIEEANAKLRKAFMGTPESKE